MPINFRFNIKTRLIISGVLFALGIFIILQISLFQTQDISSAQAASAHKVRGWGWSENIGWISMNCYNDYSECNGGSRDGLWCLTDDPDCLPDGVCEKLGDFENCCSGGDIAYCPGGLSTDYGVHYNTTNGKLTGYAWSDGVGWICFGETCQTVCLGGTNNGADCSINGDADCMGGGECGGKPPHGLPVSWACVGNPGWYCTDGDRNDCKYNSQCILWGQGLCRFSCSDDAGEDFVDRTECGRTSHLKAHWKMNDIGTEFGGCNKEVNCLEDESNNTPKNPGFLQPDYPTNAPVQIKGKFSSGLQFDGDDYIEVADSDSLSVTGNLTIEAWIKRSSIVGEQTIIGKWDESTGFKSYRLWFDVNNRLNFTVSDGTNIPTITQKDGICLGLDAEVTQCTSDDNCATGEICKNAPITDTGKWHHVAGKYISLTSVNAPSLQIFIDGSKVPTFVVEEIIPNTLTDKTEKLYIGAKKVTTATMDTYFNGIIDNVSVWSCQNTDRIKGRSKKEIWDDSRIELDGWARVINLGEKGWLKLKGFTKDGRVWGSSLDHYSTFYTFNGYMGNRWVDESMNSNGLIAHWKMNEPDWDGTTDEVVDSSENTNHGTAYNGVNVTNQGIFNSAGDFDGTDDYVNAGTDTILDISGDMTIEMWIKPNTLPTLTNIGFIAKRPLIGGAARWHFGINNDLSGYNFYNGSAEYQSSERPDINEWAHIAMVLDSGIDVRYYENGVLVDTVVGASMGTATGDPVTIGKSGVDTLFDGFIDNVAIYNRALTPLEILVAYNKRIPACVGWEDYEHDYGDPPAPLPFNSLSVANGATCNQLLVYWTPSTWAENYTYWWVQEDDTCLACTDETTCTDNNYTEYNVLAGSCTELDCSLTDIGLDSNTGYCYNITAHNETGLTWATHNPPNYPAPYWKSTTLCSPEGLGGDADTCGQVTLSWNKGTDVDGYNIYRSLAESGLSSCDSLTYDGCELTGHLAEALDYNAENGPTNDLIAQWKMNEAGWIGTTGEVADSSTQTPLNNGTASCVGVDCVKPTTIATGIFNRAGIFDGVDDYITVGNMESHNNTAYTIEFWVNGAAQDDKRFYSESNTALANPFFGIGSGTGLGDTAKVRVFIRNDDESTALDIESTSNVLNSTWHHIAWVDNNGSYVLYIDGTQDLSGSYTKTSKTLDDANIGCHDINSVPGSYFAGKIDNLSIYNVAKSEEQVKIDYEAGTNPNCVSGQCGLAYVCDDATSTDKCGANNTCCYTDSRIIPYINYYYRITATGETGETPSTGIGPAQTICFPALEEEEE